MRQKTETQGAFLLQQLIYFTFTVIKQATVKPGVRAKLSVIHTFL